jgi:hypothetical protein
MGCGHISWFAVADCPPEQGDAMYCLTCMEPTHRRYDLDKDSEGNDVPGEFRWLCRQSKCGACWRTGQSETMAVAQASNHIKRYPRHYVRIISPSGVVIGSFGRDLDGVLSGWEDQQLSDVPF